MSDKNFKICLPKKIQIANKNDTSGMTRAVAVLGKFWDRGYTLKIHFMNGDDLQIKSMKETISEIVDPLDLYYEYVDDPTLSDIRISFAYGAGSYSYLGTDAKFIPYYKETLNIGWAGKDVERHEFCHALNLAHEHQNPNGGIEWNEEVVMEDLSGPPNYWDEDTIRTNVLDAYEMDEVNSTTFDPDSIMLYYFPNEWTVGNLETNSNQTLSETDKKFLLDNYGEVDNPDTISPVLVLVGDDQITLPYGTEYVEQGAHAVDNKDGDITDKIEIHGEVNPYEPGIHPILYSVADEAGNSTTKVRNVLVEEDVIIDDTTTDTGDGGVIIPTEEDGDGDKKPSKLTYYIIGGVILLILILLLT